MASLNFVQLPHRPENWDETIENFATKTLFHESVWLDFMVAVKAASKVDYFEITRNHSTVGYFPALRDRKMLVSLYRTALFGTTVFQGPVVNKGEDQTELVDALESASLDSGVDILQLRNDWLDKLTMARRGYQMTSGLNHVCPLPLDQSAAWDAMRGPCRTRIRKAEREGLVAEVVTDPAIAECFHAFYRETLKAKGQVPGHDASCYRALIEMLTPADRLFTICVKYRDRIIGVGFYAHDDRAMYYLDAASDPSCLHLCPNELLHWTAMKLAIQRGIPAFNIGGGPVPSRFSQKFGGQSVGYHEYSKTLNPILKPVQVLYEKIREYKYETVVGGFVADAMETQIFETGLLLPAF